MDLVDRVSNLSTMTPRIPYRRLPGRSGLVFRDSLWMGPDHLLKVRSTPFAQTYRRYHFTDIQAIVVTEIENFLAPIGYSAAAFLGLTVFALFYIQMTFWAIFISLFTLAVLWWSIEQPNCDTYLLTFVSQDKLPSLRKYRTALKTIAAVKNEIESAQGHIASEALQSGLPAAQIRKRDSTDFDIRHVTGALHVAAFWTFVRASIGWAGSLEHAQQFGLLEYGGKPARFWRAGISSARGHPAI